MNGSRFPSAACENPINKAKGLFWPYVEKLKKRTPAVQPRSSEPVWAQLVKRPEETSLLPPAENQSPRVKALLAEDQNPRVRNPPAMTLVLAVAGDQEVGEDKAPGRPRVELVVPRAPAGAGRRRELLELPGRLRGREEMGRRLPVEELAGPGARQAKSRRARSARAGDLGLEMTQAAARNRLQVRKKEGADAVAAMPQKSLASRRRHLPAAAGRRGVGRNLPWSQGPLLKKLPPGAGKHLRPGGRRSRLRIKSRAGALVPVVVAVQRKRPQRKLATRPGAQRVPPERAERADRPAAGAGLLARRAGREVAAAARAGAAREVRPLQVEGQGNPRAVRRWPPRRRTWSGRSWSMPSSPRKSA